MSITGGYICLYRQITQWEWYQNPNTFRVFLHCLLMANYTDGRFEGRTIKRGQFVTSLDRLSKDTKLSVKEIRTALDHLHRTGELASESCNRYRVITIVKYDEYQIEGKQNGRQRASEGQARGNQWASEGQQYNNNNKDNNYIDVDDNNILSITPGEAAESIRKDQEIEEAAVSVGLTVSPSAIMKARDLAAMYGHEELLDAIRSAVDVPKWYYVEGILRNTEKDDMDLDDHEKSMEETLRGLGRWDEEYGCSTEKADGFRAAGLSPEEAKDEMEARRRRFAQYEVDVRKRRLRGQTG